MKGLLREVLESPSLEVLQSWVDVGHGLVVAFAVLS